MTETATTQATTTILVAMRTGIDRRAFGDAIADIKSMGGTFDPADKVWQIDPSNPIVQMHRKHAVSYNERYPEREPHPTAPAAIIAERIGRHAEVVEVAL